MSKGNSAAGVNKSLAAISRVMMGAGGYGAIINYVYC